MAVSKYNWPATPSSALIPPFSTAPQKLCTDSDLLREEISKVETNEEVVPFLRSQSEFRGAGDGQKLKGTQ